MKKRCARRDELPTREAPVCTRLCAQLHSKQAAVLAPNKRASGALPPRGRPVGLVCPPHPTSMHTTCVWRARRRALTRTTSVPTGPGEEILWDYGPDHHLLGLGPLPALPLAVRSALGPPRPLASFGEPVDAAFAAIDDLIFARTADQAVLSQIVEALQSRARMAAAREAMQQQQAAFALTHAASAGKRKAAAAAPTPQARREPTHTHMPAATPHARGPEARRPNRAMRPWMPRCSPLWPPSLSAATRPRTHTRSPLPDCHPRAGEAL